MAKRFETLAEATQAWVAEFSRFPTDMIETLMAACDPDDWIK